MFLLDLISEIHVIYNEETTAVEGVLLSGAPKTMSGGPFAFRLYIVWPQWPEACPVGRKGSNVSGRILLIRLLFVISFVHSCVHGYQTLFGAAGVFHVQLCVFQRIYYPSRTVQSCSVIVGLAQLFWFAVPSLLLLIQKML